MYKSPVEVLTTDIQYQIDKGLAEETFKAIVSVGINVDKEEMIRALQYDREQYEKGYADAMASIVRCKDCDSLCTCGNDSYICSRWGSWTDPDGWCHKGERREGE